MHMDDYIIVTPVYQEFLHMFVYISRSCNEIIINNMHQGLLRGSLLTCQYDAAEGLYFNKKY